MTECNEKQLEFHALGKRAVIGKFEGGAISSDGGALLLSEVEAKTHIVDRLGGLFVDHRKPDLIEHSVRELIGQRVFGLVLGYEDLNDHDRLRFDPLLAAAVGKLDPSGEDRRCEQDKGKALASSSTLNLLELTAKVIAENERYKKIVANPEGMDRLFVDCFLESYEQPPPQIWIDLDATDDPTHGQQEGRFFHGDYGHCPATCRCTSSAASTCCVRAFARQTSMPPPAALKSSIGSSSKSVPVGPRRKSSRAATRAFAVKTLPGLVRGQRCGLRAGAREEFATACHESERAHSSADQLSRRWRGLPRIR